MMEDNVPEGVDIQAQQQISVQYKPLFSKEALDNLQTRLKEEEDKHETVPDSEGYYYGDQLYFEYKIMYDRALAKRTIDSRFQAQAEVTSHR